MENASDARYDRRHTKRNQSRVENILAHCEPGQRALDIGCNLGYFSRALLERSIAQNVDAIEYDANTVDERLKQDERFNLFIGDAKEFQFSHVYDMAIYGAVHHHIFGLHGYNAAMDFWNDLVDHTESRIFFETGQLAEGSRWYWQRAIRAVYNSDERYIGEMIAAIGPRFKSLSVIGRYSIHGVRRWLLKIELWPRDQTTNERSDLIDGIECEEPLQRTIGSKGQKLSAKSDDTEQTLFEGVQFCVGKTSEGKKVFCKKYAADKKHIAELSIGRQIDDERFVSAYGESAEHGMVFPFVEGTPLSEMSRADIADPQKLTDQLLSIRQFASQKEITLEFPGAKSLRLIDAIDMHPANLFLSPDTQSITVLDLEFYSTQNASRNHYQLAKTILKLGSINAQSIGLFVSSAAAHFLELAKVPFYPSEVRIQARADNLLHRCYVEARDLFDRIVKKILPSYWQ